MELIFNIAPIIFYLKFSFVLFLFFLNIYLIYKKEEITLPSFAPTVVATASGKGGKAAPQAGIKGELESGFGNKNLRGILAALGTVGGYLSAYITVKNEIKDYQIGKLNQIAVTEREEIRRNLDKDKEEHQRLLNSIDLSRDELYKLHGDKAKMVGHNDRLLTLHNKIKENVTSFKDKSTESNIKISELGIIDQLIKQDTGKFTHEINSLISEFENSFSTDHQPEAGQISSLPPYGGSYASAKRRKFNLYLR